LLDCGKYLPDEKCLWLVKITISRECASAP
jgi:hypothetical protein